MPSKKTLHRSKRLPRNSSGDIELLLVQPVEYLGKQGDVVHVRPGYANNYLLPQGVAVVATQHHKRMVEKHRSRLEEIERARLSGLKSLAGEIGKLSLTIEANANDEGHLYGSVGPADIANALKRSKVTVAQDQVRLKGPLKELGLYTVQVHLGPDIEADLKIWVVPSVSDESAAGGGAPPKPS